MTTGANTLTVTGASGLTINSGAGVKVDVDNGSGVVVLSGGGASHTIDGELRLSLSGSTLSITSNDAGIIGDGKIEGRNNAAMIDIADDKDLTSSINIVGSMVIHGDSSTPPDAGFENNGLVEANRDGGSDNRLTLAEGRFTGSGEWKVATASAFLEFAEDVLADRETAPMLTGPFTVSNGTLDINEDVFTSGDLTQTGGKIDIAPNKKFTAG